jgi:hypothetical protein
MKIKQLEEVGIYEVGLFFVQLLVVITEKVLLGAKGRDHPCAGKDFRKVCRQRRCNWRSGGRLNPGSARPRFP